MKLRKMKTLESETNLRRSIKSFKLKTTTIEVVENPKLKTLEN